jgi:hypothetical protein
MSETVPRSITAGGWPLAFGDQGAPATVCSELGAVVELAPAAEVAALASAHDVDAAAGRGWIELASSGRRRTPGDEEFVHGRDE